MNLFKWIGLPTKELRAWAIYDWANSAFATTIMAAVLPIYFAQVAAADLDENLRTTAWAYTSSLSMLLIAVASPVLGAVADFMGARKRFLAGFMMMGVISTVCLCLVYRGDWLLACILYIFGTVGFAGGNVFYDSLLPHVAHDQDVDRVSIAGFALGYLGGGILLVLNAAWIIMPGTFGLASPEAAQRLSFVSVGIWWFVFSIPLLIRVREPRRTIGDGEQRSMNPVKVGFQRLSATFRKIRRYKQLLIFLAAYWLYMDGIGTIFRMATIFGQEIGIDARHLIGALILVQLLGVPFTFGFTRLADRLGPKRGIMTGLAAYCGITVFGYFMSSAWHFWVLAVLVSMVQGGCQALSRSLFASMIPKSMSAEFFGFYSVSAKFAGIFGPLIFGLVSMLTGSSRFSILFIITFFIGGILILTKLDEDAGRQAALEAFDH